jgi:transmembrane sensor
MNPAMDSERIEVAAAGWFARQQSGDWTDADEAQLSGWLDSATAHRVAFIRLKAARQYSARLKALGAGVSSGVIPPRHSWGFSPLFRQQADEVLEPASPLHAPAARTLRAWPYALAATVLVAVCVASAWYFPASDIEVYRTKIGATDTIALSDGSQVTLNTASRVRVALNETERRIELTEGEAFFNVARDTRRPFTVIAGEKHIVAVGTRFSVRRDAGDVRVVVTEGRVRLEERGDQHAPATQLDAGAVAQTRGPAVQVQQRLLPEAEQLLSWRTGYVTFRDTDLAEAVIEFNRYSPRKIAIEDPAIAHIRIGGNFRTDNVDAFLWLLENGFPIRVEHRGNGIVLTKE